MELSNFLGIIWGFSFIITGFSLLIYPKNTGKIVEAVENEVTTFFLGIIALVIGTAMVLSHNIWASNWKVVITVFGWLSLIKGISLLLWPNLLMNYIKAMKNEKWVSYALMTMVIIGCILFYFGFTM